MKLLFSLRLLASTATAALPAIAPAAFVGVLALSSLAGCTDDVALADPTVSTVPAPAACKADTDCAALADPCMTSICTAGTCGAKAKAEGEACNDDNVCNGTAEKCTAGKCVGAANSKACDDSNACTTDACDPKQGCVFLSLLSKCEDG